MILEVKGISKSYRGVKAVDNVSFTIQPGHIIGLLGPNGAGKTTTMSMITGILAPEKGQVLFDGSTMQENEIALKKKIGFLSEANPLYGEMLVSEYLCFIAALRGMSKSEMKAAIKKAAQQTGIEDRLNQPIEELSKGYKQRVGLAQAILHEPDILILDEPTEGLDPNQRVTIRDLIAKLGKDRTVIISTHVLSEVQAMCDEVIILNKGKVVTRGTVDEVMASGQKAQIIRFEARGNDIASSLKSSGFSITSTTQKGDIHHFMLMSMEAKDGRPVLFDLAKSKGWTVYELHQENASLEDIFRNLTLGEHQVASAKVEPSESKESSKTNS